MKYGSYADAIINATTNLLNYEMIRNVMEQKGENLSDEKVLEYISRIINNDNTWIYEDEAQCVVGKKNQEGKP